ncbi:phosphotriesterase-related protein [Streptomyces mirabilis]|uniref:phosphotriesterase family protein n=1 Tax=Streptomyces mirabilis TaxID=68239 RepID=UPI0021BF50B7|nr:phosphotriesterase-related protein [Streptomyces mirabilis]MCT9112913.1 phosphotriesterase-related protein [Streptomyces mirabilis]
MTTAETLRRPVAADALKTVLMHEHVIFLDEEMRRNHPELWDEGHVVAEPVEKLTGLAERGVSTIVDPTVVGPGRDVTRVARVNAHVDINMFVKGLTEGVADTGVRAGIAKCALDESLTPGVERVIRAVARAHLATGAPTVVHTSAPHKTGLVAQDVFRSKGVDPDARDLDHSGDADELDYVRTLIDQGSYMGMVRFGLGLYLPGEKRIANLVRLLDEGLADQLMLSDDASCHSDWLPPRTREQVAPSWHFAYLHQHVLPALRRAGVGEEQITTMFVDNPRRFLTRGRPS